ncbi:MAG: hypothetical protein V2A62_00125 [Candidatus Woesearchaeota archaeon]
MSIDDSDLLFRNPTTGRILIEEHTTRVYTAYEELYLRRDDFSLADYLVALKEASGIVPVHEFYQRLAKRGDITTERYQSLLRERETFLKKELRKRKEPANRKS